MRRHHRTSSTRRINEHSSVKKEKRQVHFFEDTFEMPIEYIPDDCGTPIMNEDEDETTECSLWYSQQEIRNMKKSAKHDAEQLLLATASASTSASQEQRRNSVETASAGHDHHHHRRRHHQVSGLLSEQEDVIRRILSLEKTKDGNDHNDTDDYDYTPDDILKLTQSSSSSSSSFRGLEKFVYRRLHKDRLHRVSLVNNCVFRITENLRGQPVCHDLIRTAVLTMTKPFQTLAYANAAIDEELAREIYREEGLQLQACSRRQISSPTVGVSPQPLPTKSSSLTTSIEQQQSPRRTPMFQFERIKPESSPQLQMVRSLSARTSSRHGRKLSPLQNRRLKRYSLNHTSGGGTSTTTTAPMKQFSVCLH